MPRRKRANHLSLVETKECNLWPYCSCSDILSHWAGAFTAGSEFPSTVEEIEEMTYIIGFSLQCVSFHCPDRKVKAFALAQLEQPLWGWLSTTYNRDIEERDYDAQAKHMGMK